MIEKILTSNLSLEEKSRLLRLLQTQEKCKTFIAQHPTLSTNILDIKLNQRRKCKRDITSTAQDGLTFLEIRSCFWETSGNSAITSGQQNDSSRRKRS